VREWYAKSTPTATSLAARLQSVYIRRHLNRLFRSRGGHELSARFTGVVLPGDTLTVGVRPEEDRVVRFEVTVGDRVVVRDGDARF